MLSKKEAHIMNAVLKVCKGKETCLAFPKDILKCIPYTVDITPQELDEKLKQLEYDGYIGLTFTEKKGETVYCIDLTVKGGGFERERLLYRRAVRFKIMLALVAALITFVAGRILIWIFD